MYERQESEACFRHFGFGNEKCAMDNEQDRLQPKVNLCQ